MPHLTLAVFLGQSFRRDAAGFSTGESFIKFVEAFAEIYGPITLLVRVEPEAGRDAYPVDPVRFRVVPLPFFDQFQPLRYLSARTRIRHTLSSRLQEHRAVWVGGPHLVGYDVVKICEQQRVPCFLTVRQDLVEVVSHKTKGWRRPIALFAAKWIDSRFRKLAKHHPTFVVGRRMYQAYGGERRTAVREIYINLLRDAEVRSTVPARPNGTSFRMLWVGRLSNEKGIQVLLKALAGLPGGWHLVLVGDGPERASLGALAARLGLADRVEFAGYVPFGPKLVEHYEHAHLFVLPSLTEGMPQVLLEAMASGLPCLASSVGGIPAFAREGQDICLVPPGDVAALRSALGRLIADPEQRWELANSALERVRTHTLESERAKIAEVLNARFGLRPAAQPWGDE